MLVDGVDVRDMAAGTLRRHVGVVLQDPFLFTGTIAHNIGLNEARITDEQVRQAARYVHADEFIAALPDGLRRRRCWSAAPASRSARSS